MSSERAFEFPMPPGAAWQAAFERVCARADEAGIAIDGDAASGTFQGRAAGSYEVSDGTIRVRIAKKPRLVPWALVESNLREAFSA